MPSQTRRNPSQWQALVAQQIESGLTATEFCRQHELSFNYFCKRKRAIQKLPKREQPLNQFIKLHPKPETIPVTETGLIIHYHGTQLHIASKIDPNWIAQLLQALS